MFARVLKALGSDHRVSSAYHPESQVTLEMVHQTLKSKYCLESHKDKDEVSHLFLFAPGEVLQESLGFIPAKYVFAHKVQGPLKLLQEVGDPRTVLHESS